MSRKYSDNKYDKPGLDAKIEQQTLKALESMGVKMNPNEYENTVASGSAQRDGMEVFNMKGSKESKKTNPFGLDFGDMPDELTQLIEKEMAQT